MPLLSELKIDRRDRRPVAEQIAAYVGELVTAGRLTAGTRLPSIRELAERVGVSCNSAVHAYEILSDRGLVASRPCSGYFVSPQPLKGRQGEHGDHEAHGGSFLSDRVRRPERDSLRYAAFLGGEVADGLGDDLAVAHDLRVAFHHLGQQLDRGQASLPAAAGALGWSPSGVLHSPIASALTEALCQELLVLGLPLMGPDNLIVLPSLPEALLSIFLAIGVQRGGCVLIEEPGDPRVRAVAIALGLRLQKVRRSKAGLALAQGFEGESPAHPRLSDSAQAWGPRVLVLAPTSHNPTGSTLSLSERQSVLEWARRHEVVVVELDSFPGLWFGEAGQSPLAALEHGDRVIHVSALGSVFSSRLTTHAICASKSVIEALQAWSQLLVEPAENSLQLALLGDLVSRGGRSKQILRLQRVLAARRTSVEGLLREVCSEDCQWSLPDGGLYAWVDASRSIPCDFAANHEPSNTLVDVMTGSSSPDGFLVDGSVFGSDACFQRCCRLNLGRFDATTARPTLEAWWRRICFAHRH